jgi:biopolymer transport protein ExbD
MSMRSRKKKRRFVASGRQKEDMSLQITAMADIFTVLLVFLLKTFSTGLSTLTPNRSILLPEAQAKDVVVDALKLEVSADAVILDDQRITTLNTYRFEGADLESDGTPRSLNTALIRERAKKPLKTKLRGKAQPVVAETAPEDPNAALATKILVLADKKTPYATLKTVLDTAANHGFADFKLVVVEVK